MIELRDLVDGDYIIRVSEEGVSTNIGSTYRVELRHRIIFYDDACRGHTYPKAGQLQYFLVNKDTVWSNYMDTSCFRKQIREGKYSTIYYTEIKE